MKRAHEFFANACFATWLTCKEYPQKMVILQNIPDDRIGNSKTTCLLSLIPATIVDMASLNDLL